MMQTTTEDRNRLMPADEAALHLGVRVQTLALWRMQKRGPRYINLSQGRRPVIRYRLADLEAYAESRAVETHQ